MNRIADYFEIEAVLIEATYLKFETLLPNVKPLEVIEAEKKGSYHTGEEGRFLENVIKQFLNKHLPKSIEALSGFILRKVDHKTYQHSAQLDIIIYDVANYPVFEQFGEFAIVPPEGVLGVLSVKKNLYAQQISGELQSLSIASYLCKDNKFEGGIFTGIVSFSTSDTELDKIISFIEKREEKSYLSLVDLITVIDKYSVYKNPIKDKNIDSAEYFQVVHDDKWNTSLQLMFNGILKRFYERNSMIRPTYSDVKSRELKSLSLSKIPISSFDFSEKFEEYIKRYQQTNRKTKKPKSKK